MVEGIPVLVMDGEPPIAGSDQAAAGLPSSPASARARRRREPIRGGDQRMGDPERGLDEGERELTDEEAEEMMVEKVVALANFEVALRKAGDAMAIASSGEEQRAAAVEALGAVVRLMAAARLDMSAQGAVVALAGALEQLSSGKLHPMLTLPHRKSRGSPKLPSMALVQRAVVAAAVEVRFRECGSLPEALQWVAQRTDAWRIWGAGSANRAGQLKRWRKSVTRQSRGNLAWNVFHHYADPSRFSAEAVLKEAAPRFGTPGARPRKAENPGG